jgi:hypothetical protein
MESFKENTPMPKIKNSEVNELKNIKYKTNTKTSHDTDLSQVELFLENEKKNNQSEPWSKLDKTTRYKKVEEFAIAYTEKNNIADTSDLISFLKDAIDKKKIYRVKDIIYDKNDSRIKEIPGLVYLNLDNKKFTLKNVNKLTAKISKE